MAAGASSRQTVGASMTGSTCVACLRFSSRFNFLRAAMLGLAAALASSCEVDFADALESFPGVDFLVLVPSWAEPRSVDASCWQPSPRELNPRANANSQPEEP